MSHETSSLHDLGGGDGRMLAKRRNSVLRRDNWTCHYCGDYASTADHIIPKSKGGTNATSNLVACCPPCNFRKSNKKYDFVLFRGKALPGPYRIPDKKPEDWLVPKRRKFNTNKILTINGHPSPTDLKLEQKFRNIIREENHEELIPLCKEK